jgi:C4-dicarboxylate-specific signal transduction histidine kinase
MSEPQQRIAELERQLQQSRQQVRRLERLSEMGKLTAVVAHELSHPLLGIKAFAQMIERRCGQDDFLAPKIRLIVEQAEVMQGILDGLREFSSARPAHREADPIRVVRTAAALVQQRMRRARIDFALDLPERLPPVRGSAGELQQVVVNLLSNALEAVAAAAGGDGAFVRVRGEAAADGVRLLVADSGSGVADGDRSRLFEPFYTTKAESGGTGLGLAICCDILDGQGGRIRLLRPDAARERFGAGVGAVFEVLLAHAPDDARAAGDGGPTGAA